MINKRILLLLLTALVPLSCEKSVSPGESRLVVEGWIENGGHPMVMLSESFPVELNKEISAEDMLRNLVKWAKVTVSDGDRTVTLTGMVDESYFPPYVFTTGSMTGEVGKTYSLRVEYKDYVALAETTIPAPVPLDTVYVAAVKDSVCHVVCGFTDPPESGNCYKFFTRTTGKDTRYHPSVLAQLDDSQLHGYTEVFLYSTLRLMDLISQPNLRQGDELWVKMCTMSPKSFQFWKNFETTLLSNVFNMDFWVEDQSNIQGGLGYWIGYGVDREVCLQLE